MPGCTSDKKIIEGEREGVSPPAIIVMREDIKSFIANVQKPARYIGAELGSTYKDLSNVDLRIAFCFPDIYEIGMSNLGMRILCGVLNEIDNVWAERVYSPWTDMEEQMRARKIPLFTAESGDAVGDFDIVAFTLQYELCYSTALNMMELAGIPLLGSERGEDSPIILAGGPCAYNPEPMADFVDIFSIGEGEEALPELARLWLRMKADGTYSRTAFLREASHLDGFYVPSLYDVKYKDDGTIASISPKYPDVPAVVTKRVIGDLDHAYFPVNTEIPFIETVHDRVTLEVFRGCIRGCRFCQAGFVCRPVREKSPEALNEAAKKSADASGYEEISLSCLSISDYSQINRLTDTLLEWTDDRKINLSLPSMRADSFTKELMEKVSGVRTSTITFAPEAGTKRLRDIINKNIEEEDILKASHIAYAAGKTKIKLYFMMGLPGETYEDIAGIASLAHNVVEEFFRTEERNRRIQPQVTTSVACFIPKPHTPFQWVGQNTFDELYDKQRFLAEQITDRRVKHNYHDVEVSRLEAVFARGDRRLSKALLEARRRGIRLDAWEEMFSYDAWCEVFDAVGLDMSFYANRTIPEDEILPWDMIDCGVSKEFFLREYRKAKEGIPTQNCKEGCSGCGVNSLVDPEYCRYCPGHPVPRDDSVFRPAKKPESDFVPTLDAPTEKHRPGRTVRVRFSKGGALAYIGHLDLAKFMIRQLVRSKLPVWYTEGFNPRPHLVFASSLSVGCGGEREIMDFRLDGEATDEAIKAALSPLMPRGIEILDVFTAEHKLKEIEWGEYEIVYDTTRDGITGEIAELFSAPVLMMKRTKSGEKEVDITTLMTDLSSSDDGGMLKVSFLANAADSRYLNPVYIARALEQKLGFASPYRISRKRLLFADKTEFR